MKIIFKITIITIMIFKSNVSFSQLSKYNFESYDLSTQEEINKHKDDVLSIANLLLKESIKNNKDLRFEAGYFLNQWMKNNDEYNFGTGNLRHLLGEEDDLLIISIASQIKFCLENNSNSSYDWESVVGIWGIIANYVGNKKNKVKLTKKLKKLVKAKNENKLSEFLRQNE